MSDIKIQPSATGSATVTLTAPATGTARTVTLPDSTDTLAVNSDVTNKLPLAGGTLTGNLNIGSYTANSNADNLVIQEAGDFTGITLAADNDQGSNIYFADPEDNNVGGITYNHSSNYMNFRVNGAERLRVLSSGGLTFNGDTAAANALDDYEEGTWTVAITMGSGTAAVNSSHNTLSYTKVGRLVTIGGQFRVGSVSSPDGEFKINLPFTSISTDGGSGYCSGTYRAYNIDTPNDGVAPVIHNNVGAADATLQWSRDGSTPTNERATTDGYFMIGLAYMTV